jgi:hypothetical protein
MNLSVYVVPEFGNDMSHAILGRPSSSDDLRVTFKVAFFPTPAALFVVSSTALNFKAVWKSRSRKKLLVVATRTKATVVKQLD